MGALEGSQLETRLPSISTPVDSQASSRGSALRSISPPTARPLISKRETQSRVAVKALPWSASGRL